MLVVAACGRFDFDPFVPLDGSPTGRWAAAFAGGAHSCLVRDDAQTWCWGSNYHGDLGIGARMFSSPPAQVRGDWRTLRPFGGSGCGIAADRTLWCWGDGNQGQIGDGGFVDQTVPERIDTATDWTDLAVGDAHACALESTGALWCWGNNTAYQFDPTNGTVPSKRQIAGTYRSVAASSAHTCVVASNGALACIGIDNAGELGQNATTLTLTGYTGVGSDSDWAQIALGVTHACALKTGGSLWCWGANRFGAVGVGDRTNRLVPTRVDAATDWASVQVGDDHTCAQKTDGSLWCWGMTSRGQFGGARTADALTPSPLGHVRSYAVGSSHTCFVDDVGAAWCSGVNSYAQVRSPAAMSTTPVLADEPGAPTWTALYAYRFSLCGIDTNGQLWCWGYNGDGQLGDGTTRDRQRPVLVSGSGWQTVALGYYSTYAIAGGQLLTWGSGVVSPTVFDSNTTWTSLAAGDVHACGVAAGQSYCWGDNTYGQLGTGDFVAHTGPTPTVLALGVVSAGARHSCGWNATTADCWGYNAEGECGDNNTTTQPLVTLVTANGQPAVPIEIAAGDLHTCALYADGELWCWGDNTSGQFGNGTMGSPNVVATPAGMASDWTDVGIGDVHTCAIKQDGTLWCFGHGDNGQLGIGSLPGGSLTPTQVGSDTDWKSVVGVHHGTCALKQDGTRWCFGANYLGQYGDGKSWIDDFVLVSIPGA